MEGVLTRSDADLRAADCLALPRSISRQRA